MAVKMSSSLILTTDINTTCSRRQTADLPKLARLLQVTCEDVEEELGIRVGVDMSMGFGIEELFQSRGVHGVAVL